MDYSVIGLSFESPLWHYVAYTVNAGAPEELLCHEIWHATEDRLTSLQWDAIDSEAWAACNPRGFTYYEDYDTAMSEADGDWLFFGGGQDVHFVDNYSTMNAREDRARIMEYIMGSDDFADELAAQPAIRQKLRFTANSAISSIPAFTSLSDDRANPAKIAAARISSAASYFPGRKPQRSRYQKLHPVRATAPRANPRQKPP